MCTWRRCNIAVGMIGINDIDVTGHNFNNVRNHTTPLYTLI